MQLPFSATAVPTTHYTTGRSIWSLVPYGETSSIALPRVFTPNWAMMVVFFALFRLAICHVRRRTREEARRRMVECTPGGLVSSRLPGQATPLVDGLAFSTSSPPH